MNLFNGMEYNCQHDQLFRQKRSTFQVILNVLIKEN